MPIFLTVRAFTPVDYWLPSLLHFLKHSPASVYALRFVLLPVNYFAELGFFLVAAVLYWRWRRSGCMYCLIGLQAPNVLSRAF